MGLLDDALRQFTQTGQVPPQMVEIFQELILGPQNQQSSGQPGATAPQQQAQAPQAAPAQPDGSSQQPGLGSLLEQLQSGGLDEVVKSWLGPGQNQEVHP